MHVKARRASSELHPEFADTLPQRERGPRLWRPAAVTCRSPPDHHPGQNTWHGAEEAHELDAFSYA